MESALLDRLDESVEKEFYFEGLFIVALLLESKVKNKARSNGINSGGNRVTFEMAIDYIHQAEFIDEKSKKNLHDWRESRNELVHSLLENGVNEEYIKSIIHNGKLLFKELGELDG